MRNTPDALSRRGDVGVPCDASAAGVLVLFQPSALMGPHNQKGDAFMKYLATILVLLLAMMPACASDPVPGEDAATALRSGAMPNSEASNGDTVVPVAGSYMGAATNSPITAKAERSVSSSAAFRQGGLDLASTLRATATAYADLIDKDATLTALRAEYAALAADPNSTAESRAELLSRIEARDDKLRAMLKDAGGGGLQSLTHLTVTNIATNAGNSGHEPKPLTDKEAEAAASSIPAVIKEARKKPGD